MERTRGYHGFCIVRGARRLRAATLLLALLAACACSTPAPANSTSGQASGGEPAAPARSLLVAFRNEVSVLEPSMNSGGSNTDFDALTNAYLAYLTPDQRPMPYLAQTPPSLERAPCKL